ncbi:Hypothetical predicted protein [Paramuricea clavata]|uniref:Uncharacterized protein n=1 Tax=Paramuricea clavata TaxID=317549 RepID=A0A7D9ERD5_PARCT|nr:Hypothetical predicted protein [Paramuricea clavata]
MLESIKLVAKSEVPYENMKTSLYIDPPSSLFPLLKEHSQDILSSKFKGTKLVQGWKVVSKETSVDDEGNPITIHHWNARETKDVETNLEVFISDLLLSFDNRITKGSDEPISILTCLDLNTIFSFLCAKRLRNGYLLVRHPLRDHVKKLSCDLEEVDLLFDPAFAHIVLHKIKQALKLFLWKNKGKYPMKWFSLSSTEPKSYGPLTELSINDNESVQSQDEEGNKYWLGNLYSLTFGSEKPIHAELNEAAVYDSIYCDEEIYSAIGIEGCVTIDIALAKGGTEAVVESFYSIMKSQQSTRGQSNETLALRR